MKKSYIRLILGLAIILTAIGINGHYRILDRVSIKNMLVDYKQNLCTVDASNANDESYIAYKNGDLPVFIDLQTNKYKPYFTEDAFKYFYGNRISTFYYEYIVLNPTETLTFDAIKFDVFNYDAKKNRYIINYTMTFKSSSGKVFTEHNQSVVIKENGEWKISHEKIFGLLDLYK